MRTIDLSGKTAVITGGGQGLGRATAEALHAAGANVAINYFTDTDGRNRSLAEELAGALGQRALAVEADVRDLEAVRQIDLPQRTRHRADRTDQRDRTRHNQRDSHDHNLQNNRRAISNDPTVTC